MKKTEIILFILFIISLILNFFSIPGGVALSFVSLLTLSVFYFCFSFALFNNIRFRNILKKESYNGISALRILGAIATGFALSSLLIGILFKLESLPGAEYNFLAGLIILLIITVIGGIKFFKNKSDYYKKIFIRVAVYGIIGSVLFYL